jgi:chromosomal replication initiation ATPase DnaA
MSLGMDQEVGWHPPPRRGSELQVQARFIEAIVATVFRVRTDSLKSVSRGRADVAFARQVAIYLAHTRLGVPYADAGALFHRDRTTAAHACRTVEDRREDGRFDRILDHLERAVDLWPLVMSPGSDAS